MQLKDPDDRQFFHHLIECDALSMRSWNNLDLPEEGALMPALNKYVKELNLSAYASGALQLGSTFYRINNLHLRYDFVKSYPAPLLADLIKSHYVVPLTQHGSTQWFGVCRYVPFFPDEIKRLVDRKNTNTCWQVLFPHEFYSAVDFIRAKIPNFQHHYQT